MNNYEKIQIGIIICMIGASILMGISILWHVLAPYLLTFEDLYTGVIYQMHSLPLNISVPVFPDTATSATSATSAGGSL